MKRSIGMLVLAGAVAWSTGWAHDHPEPSRNVHKKISPVQHAFGREGDPAKATRTIRIGMSDAARFSREAIRVKRGTTVRFVMHNAGQVGHDVVLGTMDDLKRDAALMKKAPVREHDEPYMAHIAPGRTEVLVWHFNKPGGFYYGCLVPNHFDAGMIGTIVVR